MIDINKHRFFLLQILKDIYSDALLANSLGFKGGTAMMFFYKLPRFSTDLDFDLLNQKNEKEVYDKIREIILKYGSIHDEAKKHFGPLVVLDYGSGERKLKVEISKRDFGSSYSIKNLLGINIRVMETADMFAHKLCALVDRNTIAKRDIFDSWFFMKNKTPLNKDIIETRMKVSLNKHFENCIRQLEKRKSKKLLYGLGELLDDELKPFVRKDLLKETIEYLKFYKEYPLLK
jgi:predicted nucleotidyltransferase component of viral defense system